MATRILITLFLIFGNIACGKAHKSDRLDMPATLDNAEQDSERLEQPDPRTKQLEREQLKKEAAEDENVGKKEHAPASAQPATAPPLKPEHVDPKDAQKKKKKPSSSKSIKSKPNTAGADTAKGLIEPIIHRQKDAPPVKSPD